MKNLFRGLALCLLALCAFVACSEDDNVENMPPKEIEETRKVTDIDELRYMTRMLVRVDTLGNFISRIYGTPLDPADTTVVSIGVENVEEAVEMFKGWLSPDTRVDDNGNSIIASLKDEEGYVPREVIFQKSETPGMFGSIDFANEVAIPGISRIEFIPSSMWPTNATSPYKVGDVGIFDSENYKNDKWICIREAKPGVDGVFMTILHNLLITAEYYYCDDYAYPEEVVAVANTLKSQSWDYWDGLFWQKAGRRLIMDSYYWTNNKAHYVLWYEIEAVRLSDGNRLWYECAWSEPTLPWIQVRYFGMQ